MEFNAARLRAKVIVSCCLPILLAIILAVVTTFRIESMLEPEVTQPVESSEGDQKATSHGIEPEVKGNITEALHTMLGGMAIIFAVFLLVSFFLSGRFTRSVGHIIDGLMDAAQDIATVSHHLLSESRQLAQDVSTQASSIEGTSSSLEQISSMTKQNADNANQADQLVNDTRQIVGTANGSVVELTVSMEDISKASEETSKIIKTIDEIAFQTNLLALNAAVEAARAGEAGSGFAVVADEVRNLAMRAAEAAKNTSELIEGTVKRVKDGADLVTKTNENFAGVSESTVKVGELVAEIAATSNEQARDIEQVNKAVADMDSITRRNASNADKSASTSEEMNTRIEEMKGFVDELLKVFGRKSSDDDIPPADMDLRRPDMGISGKSDLPERTSFESPEKKKMVRPEQIIPLDDEDFEDF